MHEKRHKGDLNYTGKYGSIVFDDEVIAGKTTEAQTVLAPGNYVLLVSAGEGPAQVRTHFTVTPSKTPAALPLAEAKIGSIDFGFRGPSTLHDGEVVAFENEGFLVHMDVAAPVKNMKNAKKLVKAMLTGNERPSES